MLGNGMQKLENDLWMKCHKRESPTRIKDTSFKVRTIYISNSVMDLYVHTYSITADKLVESRCPVSDHPGPRLADVTSRDSRRAMVIDAYPRASYSEPQLRRR
ncbi:hypothetical protein NEOLEDRAFT_805650 [Neolentinus lepideus HHB14362 ss-1]|uniref:Uncharacterized protein n=1 Tax=Neolentinus lepideus HHB14362 ss-1 TaxID=1314782 RepID=A0A165PFN4_9AGAM|nr:hypothetical protein NEOLEDRAFT_805650 [Neolentinus lepideus HHB14362 ss-1]